MKSCPLQRILFCSAVIATAIGVCAEPARGGEAKVGGFPWNVQLVYTAAPGETNVVSVTLSTSGLVYAVEDTGSAVTAGPGCIEVDENHAECNSMGIYSLSISAGDGDDRITTPVPAITWATGGEGADVITGGAGEDILDGGPGDDTVNGGPGDDFRLSGDAGNDQVNGGDGDDDLFGDAGNDTLSGGPGNDELEYFGASGPGSDVLAGGDGDDLVGTGSGGADDGDSLAGGPGFDRVSYWWRNDTGVSLRIDGLANDGWPGENDNVAGDFERLTASRFGDDTIVGGDNGEVIDGEVGQDSLDGRGGSDTITAAGGIIEGGAGGDTLTMNGLGTARGGEGGDVLNGGGPGPGYISYWEIKLEGGAGNDTLNGGPGNDRLDGGPGADTMTGGGGEGLRDSVDYSSRTNPVFVDLEGDADDGESGEGDLVGSDVENLLGGSGADALTGNAGDNRVVGGAGADTMGGGAGTDTLDYSDRSGRVFADLAGSGSSGEPGENDTVAADFEQVLGGSGDDVLRGNIVANWIEAGAGDDLLDGRLGADQLRGGDGDDTVDYSSRTASVHVFLGGGYDNGVSGEGDYIHSDVENALGGGGSDRLLGSNDANAIAGGPGADTLIGYSGDDLLEGGDDRDELFGWAGDDHLDGGDGDDDLDGSIGADVFVGGDGTDTVDYSSQTAPISVTIDGTADDGLSGEEDDVGVDVENVVGGSGADVLIGNDQPNVLQGGAGDDYFDGGLGADVLVGGAGIDDLVDYSSRPTAVTIKLDATPTSGGAGDGAGDTIGVDIEDAIGGAGNDTLAGSAADNILDGGPGADVIAGGAGFDLVDYSTRSVPVSVALDGIANDGASGENDAVDVEDVAGGSGPDRLSGDAGDNVLLGLAGNDVVEGGAGEDFLSGGAGDDALRSRDGEGDASSCGDGVDELVADDLDDDEGCESVHFGPPTVGGPTLRAVTQTTASFSAPVQPRGQATTVYVELGTTTSYGNRSTTVSLPATRETYTVIVNWSGLSPATAYHFRFVAANADGTTYGPDATLTTVAAPPPGPADLALSASAAPAAIALGRSVTYTITVTNRGPNDAARVVLTNSPPPGARLRSVVPSQGTCPSVLRCDLGTLGANASASVRITVSPRAAGRSSIHAGVVSDAPDPIAGNNAATATATVRAPRPRRIVLCHKGRTIKVPKSQVKKHRKHGDRLGPCRKKRKRR